MKTITFYSYKGGVGRSLALVNIATRLAELGKRVCLLDFDLEAPGLPVKFNTQISPIQVTSGFVDYVHEFITTGYIPKNIEDYSMQIPIEGNQNTITLIPAGNIDSLQYWKKLSAINWYNLIYESENGLAFFLNLKDKIQAAFQPDFLLIDSRTGISEMAGVTISILADEVVVVAANNRENLSGAKRIIDSLSNVNNAILGKTPKITFVLSRIPEQEKVKEIQLIKQIQKDFARPELYINLIHSDRELELNERVKIAYDKKEATLSSTDYLSLFENLTKDDLTTEELTSFLNLKKSEKLYLQASLAETNQSKIELINHAIELNPDNTNLYIFRANVFIDEKKFNEALEDIKLLDNKLPKAALIIDLYTRYYLTKKDWELGIDYAQRFLKLGFQYANFYLGIAYNQINQPEKAIESLQQYIAFDPSSFEAYTEIANHKKNQLLFEEAFQNVYKALELSPQYTIALTTLAEIHALKGNNEEFYVHLEQALILKMDRLDKIIPEEMEVYGKYLNDDRFKNLLRKYKVPYLIEQPSLKPQQK